MKAEYLWPHYYCPTQIFRPSYGPACMHKSYIYVGGFIAENSSQISKGVLALFSFNPIYSGHYFRPICWVWVKKQDQSYFDPKASWVRTERSKLFSTLWLERLWKVFKPKTSQKLKAKTIIKKIIHKKRSKKLPKML